MCGACNEDKNENCVSKALLSTEQIKRKLSTMKEQKTCSRRHGGNFRRLKLKLDVRRLER